MFNVFVSYFMLLSVLFRFNSIYILRKLLESAATLFHIEHFKSGLQLTVQFDLKSLNGFKIKTFLSHQVLHKTRQ